MVSTGLLSCAPDHRSIADVVAADRELMVSLLEQRIAAGKARGEMLRGADPANLARYVAAVIQGMSVQAQDGADEAALLAIAEIALAAWPSRKASNERRGKPRSIPGRDDGPRRNERSK